MDAIAPIQINLGLSFLKGNVKKLVFIYLFIYLFIIKIHTDSVDYL